MRSLGKIVICLALLAIFIVPVAAQEDNELTEEEKVLVERLAQALTKTETFTSYAFFADETSISELSIQMDDTEESQAQIFRNTQTITRDGYALVNPDGLDARTAMLHLVYTDIAPEGNTSYVLDGEARMVEDVLYANLAYTTQVGVVPELPLGWQGFKNPDEFPVGLVLLGVDGWFDEEPSVLETHAAQLIDYVTTVEMTTETLEDGSTLESITITLEGDDLSGFFTEVVEPTPDDQPFIDLISLPELEKSWLVQVKIDSAGQRVYFKTVLSYATTDIDGAMFGLVEGTLVDLSTSVAQSTLRSDFDGDFEPIVAPVETPVEAE